MAESRTRPVVNEEASRGVLEMVSALQKQFEGVDLKVVSRGRIGNDAVAINSCGTAGTAGTLTGCFGTAGTFGSLGAAEIAEQA